MHNIKIFDAQVITVNDKTYLQIKGVSEDEEIESAIHVSNICLNACEIKIVPDRGEYKPTITFAVANIKDIKLY